MTVKSRAATGAVGFVSLGCAKNLVNTEQMMFLLKENGYKVSGEISGADVVIINTCGFIESAKTEAIDNIIELGQAKEDGQFKKLIVAGCLTERYKDEIMSEMPEIDAIIGVGSFDDVVNAVETVLNNDEKKKWLGDINARISETRRVLTTSPVWAYLKIAEGCDNKCAYCVIPSIRGRFRSRSIEKIVDEAKELASCGVKELILVAQDTTKYGVDLYKKQKLADLLTELSKIESIRWIRIHYMYPDEISDEIIEVVADNDKILKYMDIPIQHINSDVLKLMNRRGTGLEIRELISKLRKRISNVVIRTSIIAGLPGEDEKEFNELCEFIKSEKIERAGVFPYSPEEGSPAALFERPDFELAAARAETLAELQSHVIDEYNESRIGSITTVLIEGFDNDRYYGRSYAESPDVDGYITVIGDDIVINEFFDVRITGILDGEPIGEKL